MRDSRYDILFQPLQIGPVTTRNRFYQVPHCSGMGRQRPETLAAMRGMKAAGGWGVVCTEYCSVHPTSDDTAFPYASLWDGSDVKANALMVDAVHEHDSLAGVELWLGGSRISNYDTRLPTLGIRSQPEPFSAHPMQSKRIDKQDIRNLRQWHADAAVRAVEAGFDIVYVYATHGYLLSEFLNPNVNQRTDEYGGSLENRVRIVRELLEVTRDAVAGKSAVAMRFSVDLSDPESYDAFALLEDLPDLFDLTVNDYSTEMGHSRFVKEGALVSHVSKAKALTKKPVVAVGRFTSPDSMAQVLRSGAQDLIGAARPSIADPFLPEKIREGRIDDIRECIGCNVCYAYDSLGAPIRCTQNPTMGEEWRRGWHPEQQFGQQFGAPKNTLETTTAAKSKSKINTANSVRGKDKALVIGAGPAGLEAARMLGLRGFDVMVADSNIKPGGRVVRESRLPGLSEWARVTDWRLGQIAKLSNVALYPDSKMSAVDAVDTEAKHIIVATGASWATDGSGRTRETPIQGIENPNRVSVNAILESLVSDHPDKTRDSINLPEQSDITILDDDHYYMGPVLALELVKRGHSVTIVTPKGQLCEWGKFSDEMEANNRAVLEAGVRVITNRCVEKFDGNTLTTSCVFTGREEILTTDKFVPLSSRIPIDQLFYELQDRSESNGLTLYRAGDCVAPGLIAAAIYSGYETGLNAGSTREENGKTVTWQPGYLASAVAFKRELPTGA